MAAVDGVLPPAQCSASDAAWATKPYLAGFKFIGGKKTEWTGPLDDVTSPIVDSATGKRAVIGSLPTMSDEDAVEAVEAAAAAWDQGQGEWPRMSLTKRIVAVEKFMEELLKVRPEMINALMWEICKNTEAATAEFDRTMVFIRAAIAEIKKDPTVGQGFKEWEEIAGGVGVKVRRGPVGVLLGLAPFNYPLNEMYGASQP